MKTILEWFKPGARVKRYMLLQIVSIAVFIYGVISLKSTLDISKTKLIAYIILLTLSAFGIIFSFIFAQRNILYISLKNIARKNKSIKVKKLLYGDPKIRKGPKIVVIGGGSGLPNLLKGLKEYTANITAIVNVSNDDLTLSSALSNEEKLTTGDLRKCIAALSTTENEMAKLLTYKADNSSRGMSIGNMAISALIDITGSFAKATQKLSEIFNMQGNIYPVTTEDLILCAGLDNGDVIVGKENIVTRTRETKSRIKQIFLKDGNAKTLPEVVDAIKTANVIVLGPGSLYTSVCSNLLLDEVSKAIAKSRAKKVYISNIMNQPGESDGYTLAMYVNEIERYIGKHVLDYAIVNNGEITEEMIKDFNQEDSAPVKIDLENIQNRAISVVKEDLVLTAPGSIIHDCDRLAEIIMKITKSNRVGDLNIVKIKKKHSKRAKMLEMKEKIRSKKANKASKKSVGKTKKVSKEKAAPKKSSKKSISPAEKIMKITKRKG